jgi:hypothetical protein
LNETPLVKFDSFALPVLVRSPSCFRDKKEEEEKKQEWGQEAKTQIYLQTGMQ